MAPTYINEAEVQSILTWPLVYDACDRALRSVCNASTCDCVHKPVSSFLMKTMTWMLDRSGKFDFFYVKYSFLNFFLIACLYVGLILSMPAYIGNYNIDGIPKTFNTLGCKLVTSFPANPQKRNIPSILATSFLFSPTSGKLSAIIEAEALTAWRTAAVSMIAVQHLFFDRSPKNIKANLAIVGTGVQGRIQAIGLCTRYNFETITIWNRTHNKTHDLKAELNSLKNTFKNPDILIIVAGSIEACVKNADVIVTLTGAITPILRRNMIKDGVHINGNFL